jgi:hypothetical protein
VKKKEERAERPLGSRTRDLPLANDRPSHRKSCGSQRDEIPFLHWTVLSWNAGGAMNETLFNVAKSDCGCISFFFFFLFWAKWTKNASLDVEEESGEAARAEAVTERCLFPSESPLPNSSSPSLHLPSNYCKLIFFFFFFLSLVFFFTRSTPLLKRWRRRYWHIHGFGENLLSPHERIENFFGAFIFSFFCFLFFLL